MMPMAASKQAPEIRPCALNSGLGASPNLPRGSDPITLKYLQPTHLILSMEFTRKDPNIPTHYSDLHYKSRYMTRGTPSLFKEVLNYANVSTGCQTVITLGSACWITLTFELAITKHQSDIQPKYKSRYNWRKNSPQYHNCQVCILYIDIVHYDFLRHLLSLSIRVDRHLQKTVPITSDMSVCAYQLLDG